MPLNGLEKEVKWRNGKLLGHRHHRYLFIFPCLCQILNLTSSFWKKSVPGLFFGGMDVHVKEGQLYVQHQKFGKVSAGQKQK